MNKLILTISAYTEVLPVCFYLLHKRKSNDSSLRIIFFLFCIIFLLDLYSLHLINVGKSNFFAFNISLLFETLLLYLFLAVIIQRQLIKKLLVILSLLFTALWVYSFLKIKSNGFFNDCVSFENISMLALILFYYYEQIIARNIHDIYAYARFWIASAYFIFIAGTFFLILYMSTLSLVDQGRFYVLNYVFVIIRTALLCVALFMKPGESKGKQLQ